MFNQLSTQDAIIAGVALFIVKDFFLSPRKELKTLDSALSKLSHQIAELNVKLSFLEKRTEEVPALRQDVNRLGQEVRKARRDQ